MAKIKPRMIVDPTWSASEAAEEAQEARCQSIEDLQLYFPEKYGKALPEGAWIRICKNIHAEYTVPPFSQWFAVPWDFSPNDIGFAGKRVRIKTPSGDLGVMPHEYVLVSNIKDWIGKESEGVFMRALDGRDVVDRDVLNYLMSRGIPRADAMLLLIEQIKSQDFAWFEMAPQYGEQFGLGWPHPNRCPFAIPYEQWKPE